MVGVVGMPNIMFLEVAKVVLEWHEVRTEAVAGGTFIHT